MATGFQYKHRLSGAAPTVRSFVVKTGVTALAIGDLVHIEGSAAARVADLAATNDTAFAGAIVGPDYKADGITPVDLANIATGERVLVVTDDDAVYAVTDANARDGGDTLDIAGTTGAMGVTTSSNVDVVVVADSASTQDTLVALSQANHYIAGK